MIKKSWDTHTASSVFSKSCLRACTDGYASLLDCVNHDFYLEFIQGEFKDLQLRFRAKPEAKKISGGLVLNTTNFQNTCTA